MEAAEKTKNSRLAREFVAALTEDIEKLKSEKVLLLNQFACTDNHGMLEIKLRVASMENLLEKLDRQEIEYASEMDMALAQYAELQQRIWTLPPCWARLRGRHLFCKGFSNPSNSKMAQAIKRNETQNDNFYIP